MFSIGEFSRITGLTVKTLRFYHEQGVLLPSTVEKSSGYRYYDKSKIEPARTIALLRKLDFPLDDVADMLKHYDDEADIVDYLEQHKRALLTRVHECKEIIKSLDQVIQREREARKVMQQEPFDVQEKLVEPLLIAGVRMKGKYSECGKAFGQIGRQFGRHINGKPMLLIYDTEYKEEDADFEACMPIRAGASKGTISVRELPGGRCVSLLHKGRYEELSRSYEQILGVVHERELQICSPCREVYLKGPGMIFKGNPKKYLTEIQLFIDD